MVSVCVCVHVFISVGSAVEWLHCFVAVVFWTVLSHLPQHGKQFYHSTLWIMSYQISYINWPTTVAIIGVNLTSKHLSIIRKNTLVSVILFYTKVSGVQNLWNKGSEAPNHFPQPHSDPPQICTLKVTIPLVLQDQQNLPCFQACYLSQTPDCCCLWCCHCCRTMQQFTDWSHDIEKYNIL